MYSHFGGKSVQLLQCFVKNDESLTRLSVILWSSVSLYEKSQFAIFVINYNAWHRNFFCHSFCDDEHFLLLIKHLNTSIFNDFVEDNTSVTRLFVKLINQVSEESWVAEICFSGAQNLSISATCCGKSILCETNYRSWDIKCLEMTYIHLSFEASKTTLRLLTRSFPRTYCSNLQKWCMRVAALHVSQGLWKILIQHILQICSVMSSWYHQPQLTDKIGETEKTIVITLNITIHFLRWQILRRHRHCKRPPIPALSLVLTLYEFCSMKKYVKIDSESALFTRYQAFDIARFWQGLRK